MKKVIFLLLLFGCGNKPETQLTPSQKKSQNIASKAISTGIAYNVFSSDSMMPYTQRLVKIVLDSTESYSEQYVESFAYLVDKRRVPTDAFVRWRMKHLIEPLPAKF